MPSPRHPHPSRRHSGQQRGQSTFKPRQPDDKAAPRSTAWLQAEQLFSAAPTSGPAPDAAPVGVTVKKNRAGPPDAAQPAHGDEGATAEKAPRVFRVEAPVIQPTAEPAPVAPLPEPAVAPRAVLRARRVSADKRPGPVLQLFTAPQAEPLDLEEAMELRHLLADVNPVLADVERAKAFQFIDEALVQRWSTVTEAIAQLDSEVRTLEARALRVEDETTA